MIVMDRVSKRYGAHQALDSVSFTVPRGQVLGLLGQNGAGKTTVLNILTGCLAPSGGAASIGGFDIMLNPRQAKRLLGYLPEQAPLYDEMTVSAYLRFVCELKEVEGKAIPGHVGEILEKTGLEKEAGRKIGNRAIASGWALPRPCAAAPRPSSWTSPPPAWIPGRAAKCAL